MREYYKYLTLCSEDEQSLMGLKQHESKYMMTDMSFLDELTLLLLQEIVKPTYVSQVTTQLSTNGV